MRGREKEGLGVRCGLILGSAVNRRCCTQGLPDWRPPLSHEREKSLQLLSGIRLTEGGTPQLFVGVSSPARTLLGRALLVYLVRLHRATSSASTGLRRQRLEPKWLLEMMMMMRHLHLRWDT